MKSNWYINWVTVGHFLVKLLRFRFYSHIVCMYDYTSNMSILYKQFSSKHFPILRLLTCTSISRQKSLSLFRLMKWVCVFIYRLRSTLVNGSEKIGSVSWIPSVRGLIRTWWSSTYVSETCEKIERWLLKLQGAEIFWRASRGLASTFSRIRNFYRRVSVIDGFSIIFLLCILYLLHVFSFSVTNSMDEQIMSKLEELHSRNSKLMNLFILFSVIGTWFLNGYEIIQTLIIFLLSILAIRLGWRPIYLMVIRLEIIEYPTTF